MHIASFAFALTAAAVAAASPARAQTIEKKAVTIAVAAPQAQLSVLPVVLAKLLGHFDQEGVTVTLQHFNAGSRAIESMLGGSADIVAGAYEATVRLRAKGQPLQSFLLFGRYPLNVLGIAKSVAPSYKSPADLKGKNIGITGPGAASHTFLNLILAQAGLRPSDVTPVTVGAGPVAVAAMRRGNEIAAISNLDLAITELAMAGDIVIVADSRTAEGTRAVYGGDYAAGSFYAPIAFAQKNPGTVQAITNAMLRTLKWIAAAKEEDILAKVPAEFYQASPAVYRRALQANLASYSPDALIPPDAPGNVLKAIARFDPEIAKANIDLAATYDNSFVERALKTVN
jgi:NitT/TauT family transport system substrate-binding protein